MSGSLSRTAFALGMWGVALFSLISVVATMEQASSGQTIEESIWTMLLISLFLWVAVLAMVIAWRLHRPRRYYS